MDCFYHLASSDALDNAQEGEIGGHLGG